MARPPYARLVLIGIALWIAMSIGLVLAFRAHYPPVAAEEARNVDLLLELTSVAAMFIFAVVLVMLGYSLVRNRQPRATQRYEAFAKRVGGAPATTVALEDGPPVYGNSAVEIVWTVVPAIIVIALTVAAYLVLTANDDNGGPGGFRTLGANEPYAAAAATGPLGQDGRPPLRVVAEGIQFAWQYQYPDLKNAQGQPLVTGVMYLPSDRDVKVITRSGITFDGKPVKYGTLHSFWVPAFRLKADAVPGSDNGFAVHPTRVGTYPVVCAELCGIGHSTMRSTVKVMESADFDRWAASQAAPPAPPTPAAAPTQGSPTP